MEPITFYQCCLFGSLGFIIMVLLLGQQRMRQVEGVMRKLAERHGATFKPGNLIDYPCIIFRQDDLELRLSAALGGKNDPSHTELRLILPCHSESWRSSSPQQSPSPAPISSPQQSSALDPASCLYLRPVSHGLLPRLVIHRHARPFLTGEREFDEVFDVRGLPEALLKRTLNAEARHSLLELQPYRPALKLALKRSLLPRVKSRRPFRLHFPPPAMQFSFYLAGLPPEVNDWEPRLQAGRLLVANLLDRPLTPKMAEEATKE